MRINAIHQRVIPFLFAFCIAACNNPEKAAPATADSTASGSAVVSQNANAPSPDASIKPAAPPSNFKDQTASINGINVHYVIGGEGEPLVLVHGFGQNWFMWNRLLPELSKHFTVIAPDLRGLGGSTGPISGSGNSVSPSGGYDKKTMASDIHELIKKLGYKSIKLAGHDIGLMVAYAYAAQYPSEVKKVALLDALLPGVEPVWHQVYTSAWWFGFFARPVSGDLVTGRERLFMTDFWTVVGHPEKFTKEETDEFIRCYSQPGAIKASFQWFAAFPRDAADNLELMKKKLTMPFLTLGGEFQSASFLGDHIRLVASNVTDIKITGAGHWLVQEQTPQVQKALLDFFVDK
jgi:pimeloyl-ACP methyl ester carboxylesterase